METLSFLLNTAKLYVNLDTYLLGAFIMLCCSFLYAHVEKHIEKRNSLGNDDPFFCFIFTILWPLTFCFIVFYIIHLLFDFVARLIASKYQ